MAKKFPIQVGDVNHYPQSFPNQRLVSSLLEIKGLQYSFECNGPSNSYQLNSDFDTALNKSLEIMGGKNFRFQPKCSTAIDFDFAMELNGEQCVFEIEKANKEKILYDFLKMHVYLASDVAAAVLIVPVNWPHNRGVVDLFSLAKGRFDLCRSFGMIDNAKYERMLIVGITQIYQGKLIDDVAIRAMKKECEVYFKGSNNS